MVNLKLEAGVREDVEKGKNASRKLRREGFLPATVYGLKKDPISIKIDNTVFRNTIRGKSLASSIFDIELGEDKGKEKESVIIKDIQRDPISREFAHIDFIRIQMKTEVDTVVPIKIIGEEDCIGVKEDSGVVQHGLRELHISCLPADIPEQIEYDIKELKMGDVIRVEDIEIKDKINILNDPNEIVVSIIHPTHLVVEEEEEVEEVEGAEEPELIGKEKEETGEGTEQADKGAPKEE